MLEVYDLKTEYLLNPQSVDEEKPRFSWKIRSDHFGVLQKMYQIMCWSEGNEIIWNSGLIESSDSLHIKYCGDRLQSRQKIHWQVTLIAIDQEGIEENVRSEMQWFTIGLLEQQDWKAYWIEPMEQNCGVIRKPVPYLRKQFQVKSNLVSARIYQTAHGLYETWMNGVTVTADRFKPGLTSYYERIQYQSYDITHLLTKGDNIWSVALGDGWWRGTTGGSTIHNFGYKVAYLGQLELIYEDGTKEVVITDEEFCWASGQLLASDMMLGDIVDARREPIGWKILTYDASAWSQVHTIREKSDSNERGYQANRIASRSVPVREKENFLPEIIRDTQGAIVLDFRQNIAGYVGMKLRNTIPGQTVHLIHGEDIDEQGRFSTDNISDTSTYLGDEFQEITYICRGTVEKNDYEYYKPLFSVFGFRYVKLEGYEVSNIKDGDFMAFAVYSDMEETGNFQCSNSELNKLVSNAKWSQKGNYLDVATDCPTRERNTWTGDNQVYVKTAGWFMDTYTFYEKWLQDQAIEQYASGKLGITFPSTSSVHNPDELENQRKRSGMSELAGPSGNGNIGEDSVGWGDSAVWIPYMTYLNYGDPQILLNHYETAKRWTEYLLNCAKDHNPLYEKEPQYHHSTEGELDADYIYDTKMHYGEWLEPIPVDSKMSSLGETLARWIKEGKPLVATAYMRRSTANMAHMGRILAEISDLDEADKLKYKKDSKRYEKISTHIASIYNKYLIGEDGRIEPGHQAAYVRALVMDLVSQEKHDLVLQQLLMEIEKNNYKLNTGFLSTPFLLPVLVQEGYSEIAYRILEQREYPSWIFPITQGATTILEKWDGMKIHRGSYNHYSYGAVCDFLFSTVAGINPDIDEPGFKHIKLRPVFGGTLIDAVALFESPYGKIESGWKKKQDGSYFYWCEIPANTTADLYLPDGRIHKLGSGRYEYTTHK